MKLVGFCKFFNEISRGYGDVFESMLKQMSKMCDVTILFNDGSNDGTGEIAKKYTIHIIGSLKNDFEAEREHLQVMVDYAKNLARTEGWTDSVWGIHIDSDELLDAPEKVRELCEFLEKNGYDSAWFHLKNLWMSEDYRVDGGFNSLWKNIIWKLTDDMKFDVSRGLHKPLHPVTLKRTFNSDISILHYGFSNLRRIANKYAVYKAHGQQGHALDRLVPVNPARVRSLTDGKVKTVSVSKEEWERVLSG